MADEERETYIEAGDPFSTFGEIANIRLESKRGLHLLSSKLNELLFNVTMTKSEEDGVSEAQKKLIKEAMTIYGDNLKRLQRAHNLINAVREIFDK